MAEIRVCELAKELGRQNREVIEVLKANGVDVKSHMSRLEEPCVRMIKEKFLQMGKEQITKVENSRTEEKTVTSKPEAEKTEAPKKKKNIIRVYHAQNASDGGKNRPKRPAADKKIRSKISAETSDGKENSGDCCEETFGSGKETGGSSKENSGESG